MTTTIVLIIIFVHWFADFALQTHEQSINKSSSNKFLLDHIFTYTGIWLWLGFAYACYSYNLPVKEFNLLCERIIYFCFITFICHFCTDWITSRINKYLWQKAEFYKSVKTAQGDKLASKYIHRFFVSIGFDQVLHYLQLFLTYKYLFL